MLFKNVTIKNVGPIANLHIDFPKSESGPKPLVIVGENGSGKSILIAHLVNSLIVGKQEVYDDVEVEKGRVFKYRSPDYITAGQDYSYSTIEFDSGIKISEWQLRGARKIFEEKLGYTPLNKDWNNIPEDKASLFSSNFGNNKSRTEDIYKKQCCLYFPVNRFEDPAWMNIKNLKVKATYTERTHITGYSDRNIICSSPLKDNMNWLLDLIFDRQIFDIDTAPYHISTEDGGSVPLPIFKGFHGSNSNIYEAVLKIVRIILNENQTVRLGAGTRQQRKISVMKNEELWIPNLFQLSSGEVQLLNLFLSIIKDYDYTEGQLNTLDDVKGIVVIDEIDLHLHSFHQREVLPALIKSFPQVQFIITTHAPLFLLGLEEAIGDDGVYILNMPHGERVSASDFSEFISAYDAFKETKRHREEIEEAIQKYSKPIVFVEGAYDIRYIEKAAELLGKDDLLSRVKLMDGSGYGNLDKIWRSYNNPMSEVLPNKVILLYDCDTNKNDAQKERVFKRVMPTCEGHPIRKGIENLFPEETIAKLEEDHPEFIDFYDETIQRRRGQEVRVPSSRSVNENEKGRMCHTLCEIGTESDFRYFHVIFDMIESVIVTH